MSRIRVGKKNKPTRRERLDKVSQQLIMAGVSIDALHTTLEKEGRSDLRSLIEDELYVNEHGDVLPIYFYPKASKNAKQYFSNVKQCDLIYNLFLKECWLYGLSVSARSMVEIEYDIEEQDRQYLVATYAALFTPFIFIPDFYQKHVEGSRFPNQSVEEITEYVLRKLMYEHNISMVLQSINPIDRMLSRGWSSGFIAMLDSKAISFEITGKEVK